MVLFNQGWGRTDATCGSSFLGFLGQRFFASGDERTPIIAPAAYGYFVGCVGLLAHDLGAGQPQLHGAAASCTSR